MSTSFRTSIIENRMPVLISRRTQLPQRSTGHSFSYSTARVAASRSARQGIAAVGNDFICLSSRVVTESTRQKSLLPLLGGRLGCVPCGCNQPWKTARGSSARHESNQETMSIQTGMKTVLAVLFLSLSHSASSAALPARSVESYVKEADDAAAFSNIPLTLGGSGEDKAPPLSSYFKSENKGAITKCTRTCVPTCIRGGNGPGLGPLSVRKDPVVFKDGFRSRSYCLSECTQVCALSIDGGVQKK